MRKLAKNPNGGNFQFDERKWQLDLTDTILVDVSKRGKNTDNSFCLRFLMCLFIVSTIQVYYVLYFRIVRLTHRLE